ncbi:phage tail assembly chaperone [Cohnella sp. JJ-181]|uniref:phage tail assembly chaperone n=1 Tax=Cohnella rhizoplanae TaxID=2974897 RepID=UPI0022FF8643|nr:phage portal protein [Cohnella sp. JJ-181]CAI6087172.1 putative protein YqbN [Cohnella sp. JJ-181]
MTDMSLFFAENVAQADEVEVVVSDRYKDKDGKTLAWCLRAISEDENDELRNAATKRVKGKNGVQVPETDYAAYLGRLIAACVIYPNLNDTALQTSYGVKGAPALVRKMLLSGEYATLAAKVQEINGFDRDLSEMADEVKN